MVYLLIPMQSPPRKFSNQVRNAIRLKHYAYRAQKTYGEAFVTKKLDDAIKIALAIAPTNTMNIDNKDGLKMKVQK